MHLLTIIRFLSLLIGLLSINLLYTWFMSLRINDVVYDELKVSSSCKQ
jgi:hypothetical protein